MKERGDLSFASNFRTDFFSISLFLNIFSPDKIQKGCRKVWFVRGGERSSEKLGKNNFVQKTFQTNTRRAVYSNWCMDKCTYCRPKSINQCKVALNG